MSLSFDHHISKKFNQELEAVRSDLMRMGGIVEQQLQSAVDSLIQADSKLAQTVVKNDNRVNDLEIKIDEECTQIIARRQPTASDLRFIIAVSKTVGNIERIGDHGVKVAKKALELIGASEQPNGYVEIRHISEKVIVMFNKALDAFARLDANAALEVIKADEQVNLEYSSAIRVMITSMMEDPRNISRSLEVIWALRSLERVGDQSINIAEQVIYLVKGKDMRHKSMQEIEDIMEN